ncbi:hypothetical protein AB0H51_27320 [Streptomyces griseoluteus]|uniref:hypothetical protein n=1 Tax=Streptomyces griseoluteus TaxID=29306 RepID=UPI0034080CEF
MYLEPQQRVWALHRRWLMQAPSDGALDGVLRHHLTTPPPFSEVRPHQLGGAFAQVPAEATAFSRRTPGMPCNVIARSPDAADFDAHVAWARATREDIAARASETTATSTITPWRIRSRSAVRRSASA